MKSETGAAQNFVRALPVCLASAGIALALILLTPARVLSGAVLREEEAYPVRYEVFFVDASDRGRMIFNSQSGSQPEGTLLAIRFPERIVGADGYRWEAQVKSPVTEELQQAGTHKFYVEYRRGERVVTPDREEEKEHERQKKLGAWLDVARGADCLLTGRRPEDISDAVLLVSDDAGNSGRIRELVSVINDGQWHEFYLIGKNYTPRVQPAGLYFDAEYSSVTLEKFSAGGADYTVVRAGVKRHWTPQTCAHRWAQAVTVPGTCLDQGSETVRCEKCVLEETVILPAMGHADTDGDTLCDRCGRRVFSQGAGDSLRARLHTPQGELTIRFTCLDDDYLGSGAMLYLADESMGPEITGLCFGEDSEYNRSGIRRYFSRSFVNNLSIGAALREIPRPDSDGSFDYACLLSEEEYIRYRERISGGQGHFLRTASGDGGILAVGLDGSVSEVPAAGNQGYGVRPFILLDRPETGETAKPTVWKAGDLQVRRIGGRSYVFRCVDEDYGDGEANHRKAALFLCDSVIRSDADSDAGPFKPLSFGRNSNYKKSEVRVWLTEHASDALFSLEPIYTGVNTAYTGGTGEGMFGQMDPASLRRHGIGFQLLEDHLFCLSVEEAIRYRDELWRFCGSQSDNPGTQISPYSGGYYLRTPVYTEDDSGIFRYSDEVYVVDLGKGNIHAAKTDSSGIGLRPAFALPQGGR